jgi:hypothetical protein
MRLDGDHPRAGGHQRRGERARTGADVHDDRTATDGRVSDETGRPSTVELVPPPPPR